MFEVRRTHDFGASVQVNEAVISAFKEGILRFASLMVAGPAVEDAVAKRALITGITGPKIFAALDGTILIASILIPMYALLLLFTGIHNAWDSVVYLVLYSRAGENEKMDRD